MMPCASFGVEGRVLFKMSQNELLLKIKGDSAGGKAAIAETRAAMATLRTSVGTEMSALRVSTTNAAQGTRQLVNGFQALSAGVTVIDGPLGGIASRIRAMGTVASEATQILGATGTAAAGTGAQIAAIAGPIGLAIAAAAAMVGVAALLTKGLFDLAVTAADFRGKMFDLSQQTGVAVETLSTLEIAAKTTGGSIESIAQSLVIFQGHLDDAQDATSKMGIKFKELGISTNDTETAFRDALTQIAKMPEGFDQTNTAAELFGRRGGKQILAILKELDGDLDGATEKFRELGIVISEEDARAADEFNDQLAILNFQFRALLGKEVLPAALTALKALSSLFADNRASINGFAQVLGLLSRTVLPVFLTELNKVYVVLTLIDQAAKVLDRLRGNITPGVEAGVGAVNPLEGLQGSAAAVIPVKSVREKATGAGGRSDAERELEQQISFFQELNEALRETQDALDGVDTKTRAYAVAQAIANGALAKASEEQKTAWLLAARFIDSNTTQIRLNKELVEFQKKQKEAVLALTQTEGNYIQQAEDLIASLERQGDFLDAAVKATLRADAATLHLAETLKRVTDAFTELAGMTLPTFALDPEAIAATAGAAADATAGIPPAVQSTIDVFGELGRQISDVFGLGREGAEIFGGLMTNAFGQLAQAVGESVRAFVLFGGAGVGVKKFTAVLISEIAKMAAVQAVWELAQGLAMLALNFFWPDPKLAASATAHFHAAAVYGGLGAIAAGLGRAVAGGSFGETGGGGGGATGAGGSGRNPSDRPAAIEMDRRQGSQTPQTQGMTLTLNVPSGWLETELRRDYDLNGYSRLLIKEGV